MGRRRYQKPPVHRTTGSQPQWYFRARVDVLKKGGEKGRKLQRYYLGACSEMGKREAEKKRDAILSDAINKPQLIIQSQIQFGDIIKAFETDHLPSVRDVTAAGYRSKIHKWIEPTFGKKRICDIDPRAVQQWVNGMPPATRTRKCIVTVFKVIWEKAQDWGYTQQVCPARKINLGPKRVSFVRAIPTREQFQKMLGALRPDIALCAELAVLTGMRVSEIRGLPVRALDARGRMLRVEQRLDHLDIIEEPKSDKSKRVLPLGEMARRLKDRIPAGAGPDDLIFPDLPCYVHMQDLLRAAAKDAGYVARGFGWHALRRCHNTWIRKAGLSVRDAMDQMGHTTAQVNELYLVPEAEDYRRREEAVLKLQEELMGKPQGGIA